MRTRFFSAFRILLVAAVAVAALPRAARASTLGLDFIPGPGDKKFCSAELTPGCVAGWSFTITSSAQITALGVWDEDANGLADTHQVALWTSSGTQLASAFVNSASTAVGSTGPGQWLFTPISTLTLAPGTYVVGAGYSSGSADAVRFNTIASLTPGLTFGHAFVATNSVVTPTLPFPGAAANLDPGLFGANVQIVTTPEPGTIALLTTGLAALLARRRRR